MSMKNDEGTYCWQPELPLLEIHRAGETNAEVRVRGVFAHEVHWDAENECWRMAEDGGVANVCDPGVCESAPTLKALGEKIMEHFWPDARASCWRML